MAADVKFLSAPSPSSRIPELDGLRGIAITLVILLHCFWQVTPDIPHPAGFLQTSYVCFRAVTGLGWTGVDLFFVLSGFLIGGILLEVRNSHSYYRTFYARRFFRIVPLYYLWLAIYMFLFFTVRQGISTYYQDPFDLGPKSGVLWLFAFVPRVSFGKYMTLAAVWFAPTWSLAVEEQFYLFAPLLVRRLSKKALAITLGMVVMAAPLARLWVRKQFPAVGINWDPAYILLPCRADSLAVGMLAALFWRTASLRAWLSRRPWFLYGVTGVFSTGVVILSRSPNLSSFVMQTVGYSWFACFYALVLVLALERPGGPVARLTRAKWLGALGQVSYCVYLTHYATWWLFHTFLSVVMRHPAQWQYLLGSCVGLGLLYGVARMSWRNFEYPLMRRGYAYQY